MAENYVLLETIELSQTAASVTFDNIPQTGYTDLKIVVSAKTSDANTGTIANLKFNSNTSSYSSRFLNGRGDVSSSGSGSTSAGDIGRLPGVNSPVTDNVFSNTEIYVPNYTSSNFKSYSADAVTEANQTIAYATLTAGLWSNTAAITTITITSSAGSLVQYSTFSLYALAATGTTPVTAPFATGGNIVANDGTYWYHAFLSSGTFTPFKALTCDVLVVAGGGGGGADAGGGGGAGGLLPFTSQSLTAQNYSAVIGAGGAGGPLNTSGTVGVDSQFGALTLVKGGGAGTRSGIGGAGGSGGGGSGRGRTTGVDDAGGTPTSGQGNAGGAGHGDSAPTTSQSGGGGGGSGAVGSAGTAATGGNGGIGTNTYSNWHTATNTGVSGYIAAGGGGAPYTAGTFGTGGSGGGGNAASNGVSAIANTGSGGGASANAGVGGNGASGIVIVRYAMV